MLTKIDNNKLNLKINRTLTEDYLEPLKNELADTDFVSKKYSSISIDASDVTEIDFFGLQMIALFYSYLVDTLKYQKDKIILKKSTAFENLEKKMRIII